MFLTFPNKINKLCDVFFDKDNPETCSECYRSDICYKWYKGERIRILLNKVSIEIKKEV